MSRLKNFKFDEVDWSTSADTIMSIRRLVFVLEQRFSNKMVKDRHDPYCHHIIVKSPLGDNVACGRLNQDGRIGRIAVLINYRGIGIGTSLLTELIKVARHSHIPTLSLNAETDLSHFYDQQQFAADGPVYMKQGIPYQRMVKRLG